MVSRAQRPPSGRGVGKIEMVDQLGPTAIKRIDFASVFMPPSKSDNVQFGHIQSHLPR